VLWRCTLARVRARRGSAQEALEFASKARQFLADAEFPQLEISALMASAEAAMAADDRAGAEQFLARARQIAEAKGAVANLAQLEAVRAAG